MRELEQPDVWNEPERAQELGKERASLEAIVNTISGLDDTLSDSVDLVQMAAEEDDSATLESVESDLNDCEQQLAGLEFRRMFSGEMDSSNAFLDIQSGSGGTEAQVWANMLLRMYLRWGEQHGFTT